MPRVGLREANMQFSKYIKMARQGQEVIVTDRGAPIAVIKPITRAQSADQRVRMLEEQGLLKQAAHKEFSLQKPITIRGEHVSKTVLKERDER